MMPAPVDVTVFPRLDCCVPDYTGQNRVLARVLTEVKQRLGDRARIEVVPTATRRERFDYYRRMLHTLLEAGWPLPFPFGPEQLTSYQEALQSVDMGHPSSALAGLRQMGAYCFQITPVIALNGKAIFVSTVPSVPELLEAIETAVAEKEP